jgi:hypothetical protein
MRPRFRVSLPFLTAVVKGNGPIPTGMALVEAYRLEN